MKAIYVLLISLNLVILGKFVRRAFIQKAVCLSSTAYARFRAPKFQGIFGSKHAPCDYLKHAMFNVD
jgi:hypothetical protein